MTITTALILQALITTISSETPINKYFTKINHELTLYNSEAADLTWKSIISPKSTIENATIMSKKYTKWHQKTCVKLEMMQNGLNSTKKRQAYLLCRQPVLNGEEAKEYEIVYNELQTIYFDTKICIPEEFKPTNQNPKETAKAIRKYIDNVEKHANFIEELVKFEKDLVEFAVNKAINIKDGVCVTGESDFNNVKVSTDDEKVAKFIWLAWREQFGDMKEPFKELVDIKNHAAMRAGYKDLGASWRDELEIPNLRTFARDLYESIRPLYTLIHGVVRHYLGKKYDGINPYGPIPAHLLGELWSQNWSSLIKLIIPETVSLDDGLSKLKWNITHMARRAEDFYESFGLPAMTPQFWRHSIFDANGINCHGSAADMFQPGDFRVIVCPESPPKMSDFYVLHHEIGHIQYYMAYEHQPGIFRQGANSAFHESIGDTIMLGVSTPQHLNRLGIVNDSLLYATTTNKITWESIEIPLDMIILLQTALQTIPHIPFALLIDEYRWRYFEGSLKENLNEEFWKLALDLQGIRPPDVRGEGFFDAGAKYHVPDDTPYIRYFLSYFIQHQLFEELCRVAVFGQRSIDEEVPASIPLHRCDIYGSKAVGKLLKDFMSRGSSKTWQETLYKATGKATISADSIIKYFKPLQDLFKKVVEKNKIPLGW